MYVDYLIRICIYHYLRYDHKISCENYKIRSGLLKLCEKCLVELSSVRIILRAYDLRCYSHLLRPLKSKCILIVAYDRNYLRICYDFIIYGIYDGLKIGSAA